MRTRGTHPTRRKRSCARRLIVACALVLPWLSPGAVALLPEYRVGETARVDIVAPSELVAIDPNGTAEARRNEMRKIPAIYTYDANAVDRAVTQFRSAFASNRENFRLRLDRAFGPRALTASELARPRFAKLVTAFCNANRVFPLTTNLAERWAQSLPDEDMVADCEARLRAAMERRIRWEPLTPDERFGGLKILVLTPEAARASDAASVETNGFLVDKSALAGLPRARADLQKAFSETDPMLGAYLAGFLRANCVFEADLTRQVRARRTAALWSASRYEPGQFIVRQGDVIDAKSKAALDQLRAAQSGALLGEQASASRGLARWKQGFLWGALGAAALAAGLLVFVRRRSKGSLLPARLPATSAVSIGPGAAGHLPDAARTFVLAEMARWLSHSLVRRLAGQRRHLLESQQMAAAQAEELEQRLAAVQQQTQNRFRAYEERIAQLESELAAAEEEKRDLIRAKLVLARQELEAEHGRERVGLN